MNRKLSSDMHGNTGANMKTCDAPTGGGDGARVHVYNLSAQLLRRHSVDLCVAEVHLRVLRHELLEHFLLLLLVGGWQTHGLLPLVVLRLRNTGGWGLGRAGATRYGAPG